MIFRSSPIMRLNNNDICLLALVLCRRNYSQHTAVDVFEVGGSTASFSNMVTNIAKRHCLISRILGLNEHLSICMILSLKLCSCLPLHIHDSRSYFLRDNNSAHVVCSLITSIP